MRTGWGMLGVLFMATGALADGGGTDIGRYQALPLAGSDSKGGGRALILDTRDGDVWVWSENELIVAPDGHRRYGTGFVYQGKLRPGTRPGELIEPQAK